MHRRVREEPGVPVRAVPRRRHDPRARDEVDGRGDGRRRQLRHGVREGAARRPGSGCRETGTAFISVNNDDKAERAADRARPGRRSGFQLVGDARHGRVPARARPRRRAWSSRSTRGGRTSADEIVNSRSQLVINTPLGRESFFDDRTVRRAAMMHGVPCITTLTGAAAAVSAIRALRERGRSTSARCRTTTPRSAQNLPDAAAAPRSRFCHYSPAGALNRPDSGCAAVCIDRGMPLSLLFALLLAVGLTAGIHADITLASLVTKLLAACLTGAWFARHLELKPLSLGLLSCTLVCGAALHGMHAVDRAEHSSLRRWFDQRIGGWSADRASTRDEPVRVRGSLTRDAAVTPVGATLQVAVTHVSIGGAWEPVDGGRVRECRRRPGQRCRGRVAGGTTGGVPGRAPYRGALPERRRAGRRAGPGPSRNRAGGIREERGARRGSRQRALVA